MNWYKKADLTNNLGRCYELSSKYVQNHPDAILAHGTINGRRFTGKDFDNLHAWVEEGNRVIDIVWGKEFEKQVYYELMNAKVIETYDHEQVLINILKYKHWGPWNEDNPPITLEGLGF